MKKLLLLVAVLLLSTLISMSMINRVGADSIQWWSWRGYVYFDDDSFYGKRVVAFKESSTATLFISVRNDYRTPPPTQVERQINISAVKVGFDWNINYTSAQVSLANPVTMQPDEVRVFTVVFTVPNATVASNLYLHDYKIFVEHVNSTTGAKKIVETWIEYSFTENYYFAVYSDDQAEARGTERVISKMFQTHPVFNSTGAKVLWDKAQNESNTAGTLYSGGDFAGAKTHYNNALTYINQAFTAEDAKGTSLENAELQLLQAQANALNASANLSNGLSSMWVLIGVAAVLFAIGYVIRGFAALRKPVAPA